MKIVVVRLSKFGNLTFIENAWSGGFFLEVFSRREDCRG